MSMPRAATSVATRIETRPALKSVRARTRCDWLRLPWIAAALMPSRSSCSASRLAPCLVRVKTRAWSIRPWATSSRRRSRLRSRSTRMTSCRTSVVAVFRGVDWTWAGSWRKPAASCLDVVVEGRREEQVLALRRQDGEDLADVPDEAHVEHPVGLVEDEDLDRREVGRALVHVVEEAARRRDDDLGAGAEGPELGLVADAAVDRRRTGRAAGRRRSGRSPRPGGRARGSGRGRGRAAAGAAAGRGARPRADARPASRGGTGGSAGRRRPSCRCPSGRPRGRRGRPGRGGSPGPGWGWARCSPGPRQRGGARASARVDRRTRVLCS